MFYVFSAVQEDGAPYIKGDNADLSECNTFTISVDGVEVTNCSTLLPAVAVYLASFYVFNLAYPSTLKKTLTFIQKVILNIQDNVKIERSVVTRLERLNKHLDK